MKRFLHSIFYALRGIWYAFRVERNFQIHVLAAAIVVFLMIVFELRTWEYVFLTSAIVSVLVLEIVNTVFERIIDILQPRVHPYAQIMKDLMAAAVLLASLGAVIVGIFILGPYMLAWIERVW